MQLITIFAVFVYLIRRICLSEIPNGISEWDGFTELEEASIKILTTCYGSQDKTVVVIGEFPDSFIKRLSFRPTFSLIVMSNVRRRNHSSLDSAKLDYQSRRHKVHIVVTIARYYKTAVNIMLKYGLSLYDNHMASILILGWSPNTKAVGCGNRFNNAVMLANFNICNMLNVNFMCHDLKRGLVLHTSNPFANRAPDPWISDRSTEGFPFYTPNFSYFVREHREDEEMCKNIDFDKLLDLAGFPIRVIHNSYGHVAVNNRTSHVFSAIRRERIEQKKRFSFIEHFIKKVNATSKRLWIKTVVGSTLRDTSSIHLRPAILRGIDTWGYSITYPHGLECKFLITQFRGNKSQLEKIYSVIDSYSWIGVYMVYLITLIFFKFFLRQPLMIGILNLCRLTCNCGLPTLPPNGAPQIYLACLLFLVVTMQGIFCGNLASLLTHDFPARQVNSIQDLADLGYTVLVNENDFIYFDNAIFSGRLVKKLEYQDCVQQVLNDFLTACLTWGEVEKSNALKHNLYVSPGCVTSEYIATHIPWRWALEEKINTFLSMSIATNIMMPLDAIVDEKRLLEAESVEIILYPEVMTLNDLTFTFVILGIGLGCASITFIIEIMIERYNRRVTTTRVIVLN